MIGRAVPWVLAAAVWGVASIPTAPPADQLVLVSGDFKGYLSPCGCVKPMSGGLTRLGQAVREFQKSTPTVFVWVPGMVQSADRQAELKVEALAEAARQLNVDAFAPALQDLALAPGGMANAHRLSGQRMIQSQIDADRWGIPSSRQAGSFQLLSVAADREAWGLASGAPVRAAQDVIQQEVDAGAVPIVLFDGTLSQARDLAKVLARGLILYRSTAKPGNAVERVGDVGLASPGEKGKVLLALTLREGVLVSQRVLDLGPQLPDDPSMVQIKDRYLARVTKERLLDKMPREAGPRYAGSRACMSCHQDDYKVWAKSEHAQALKTLEVEKHDRDPDCVGCHVVGLDQKHGFISRQKTKFLADVGCESCHGPAADHVAQPTKRNVKRGDLKDCASCHDSQHSPGFDSQKYWPKIAH